MNAGCEVLRERVASRASDIDIVYVNGYGVPAHRGGPMFWAEHEVGLEEALKKLRHYVREQGSPFFTVSPLLENTVEAQTGAKASFSGVSVPDP
jgi:3-hydroxyacyl-CoA dehydrogenase